jgi:hypothetical protein
MWEGRETEKTDFKELAVKLWRPVPREQLTLQCKSKDNLLTEFLFFLQESQMYFLLRP